MLYMFFTFYQDIDKSESTIENHIATTSWYLIFIIMVPFYIRYKYSFDALKYYFPVVDLIANTFAASGKHDRLFKDLYKLTPNNMISFLSTNFINLLALLGVAWNGIYQAMTNNNLWLGIEVTLVMYVLTYLIPTQGIPLFVRKIDEYVDKFFAKEEPKEIKEFKPQGYIAGILIITVLMFMEGFIIKTYITSLQ